MQKKEFKNPKIAIIMPNYNGKKYLERTIPAVLNLKYSNFDFYIVDNGSSDGSVAFIETFKSVKLVISPYEKQKTRSCNYCASTIDCDFILFIDNDNFLVDQKLLISLVNETKSVDSFGCFSLAFVNEKTGIFYYGGFLGGVKKQLALNHCHPNKDIVTAMHKKLISYPQGFGIFIKKSTWDEIGGYDEYLKFGNEEVELGVKLWTRGYKNYLYSKSIQKDLGILQDSIIEKWDITHRTGADKHGQLIFGKIYCIIKFYRIVNVFKILPLLFIFHALNSIKKSVTSQTPDYFVAFLRAYFKILINLELILKKRNETMEKRCINTDLFLNIKIK